jgi:hypothetical protein
MVNKKIFIFMTLVLTGCGINLPNKSDIALDEYPYRKDLKGRIDFIGMQKIDSARGYNWTNLYKNRDNKFTINTYGNYPLEWPSERDVLMLFMNSTSVTLRQKLHLHFQDTVNYYDNIPLTVGGYEQFFYKYQETVTDSLSCLNNLSFTPYKKDEQRQMNSYILSGLKKYSNADYFLLIAIRPLEILLYDQDHQYFTINVALLTVIYNRDGEKVYSKIYKETLDDSVDNQGKFLYYNCIMQLLKNQGEQINEDLSFLLAANDAPYPTLEDLNTELQNLGDKPLDSIRFNK